ncbi:MAG TPA: ferrous iron transport protein B [Candidatus Latescibacteria bacterium]|nr:ferrous iron transport protein B [Candidatus Latescibacterota bacterium]
MHGHGARGGHRFRKGADRAIVLVGNPNVGKSVVFGLLTGQYVTVSNYPGTTVEIAQGTTGFHGSRSVVIDMPGINSLIPMSEDERVTRDILLKERSQVVLQVADAKNLRRALLITLQLAEMELPLILDLNMTDEARSRGISIDSRRLSDILGIEAIPTVATRREGTDRLVKELSNPRVSKYTVKYDRRIEEAVGKIAELLPEQPISRRSLALMLLAGDTSLVPWLKAYLREDIITKIDQIRQAVQAHYPDRLSYVINQQRMEAVDSIMKEVYSVTDKTGTSLAAHLSRWSMHPVGGIPILLGVLYLVYKFVGEFGAGTAVDFLEGVIFGRYLNPWSVRLVEYLVPISIVRDLLVGEYGLITMGLTYAVAIVLPIVGTFFVAFGLLEDSGYLPRLATMVNRLFKIIGLNGKAVLPMVLGLGCDTMATLTTRILETAKERILVTLLLALAIPCSAQLGVVLGMLGTLSLRAALVWAGVVLGVLLAVGFLSSRFIPGRGSDFILELPPIRIPQFSNMLLKTAARIEWYLKEVVPLFLLGTAVLFAFDKLQLLDIIRKAASPVIVGLLGLPIQATEAFLLGFLRRDYGAAGLFMLAKAGQLNPNQTVVSLVTITLFVPCIANFFMIIKERGLKTALGMVGFIFPFAFLVGGLLNIALKYLGVSL